MNEKFTALGALERRWEVPPWSERATLNQSYIIDSFGREIIPRLVG